MKAAAAEKGDAEKAGASRAGADKVAAESADPNKAGGDKTADPSKAGPDEASADEASADKASADKASADKTADPSKAGADKTSAEAGDGSRAGAEAAATPTDGPEKEPTKDGADSAKDGAEPAKEDAKAGGEPGRRRRVPFAHAVRLPPPRQAVVGAARATRAWSRRPSGRLTLPGVFLVALVAATAVVGAVVVPSAVRSPKPVAVDATDGAVVVPAPGALPGATAVPVLPGGTALPGLPPTTGLPGGVPPTGPVAPPTTGRPADALAAWAQTAGARVGISPVAMQAYGYAELVLAETNRSCQLSWTTLAAIGYVESRHGQANGASLQSTGRAEPEIIGDPLDGQGGRSRITDTDRGLFDRDTVYDRAIGPMQFIPTTWQEIGVDADNDGRKDPHDLDDAALAAARYLCKGGRNMTIPGDWWGAILSYNDVRRYAQDVFDKANQYGVASRT
ncbi:lytic murein transglycosylase [Micromonospora purpureochromogenes]|uniref:lytic murein transglycosylase n=1 Tax=Micromonospora purpureochromogenes TaxID=47872 RepID=UPI003F4CDE35